MRIRTTAVVALALALLAGATACQTGVQMWSPCTPASDGNPTGTDGEYVLVCTDGTWEPLMTVEEFVASARGEEVTVAPLPERPAPEATGATSATTSTTTTSTTTTTTTVPLPTLAPGCYGDIVPGSDYDLQLFGPLDVYRNAAIYDPYEGRRGGCHPGMLLWQYTVVAAADLESALARCTAVGVGPILHSFELTPVGPVPPGLYACSDGTFG